MAVVFDSGLVGRIADALGLTGRMIRTVELRAAVDEVVGIKTEEFVHRDDIPGVLAVLEERRYVAIPVNAPRWTPVGDRMPPPYTDIIVLRLVNGEYETNVAYIDSQGKIREYGGAAYGVSDGVTHWMLRHPKVKA